MLTSVSVEPGPADHRKMFSAVVARTAAAIRQDQVEFHNFVPLAWPIIEPAKEFLTNWHIDMLAEHLEAVSLGQIKRLCINIPPRYGKSNLVSVLWPAWSWTVKPWMRFIFASYSESLSVKHSLDRRLIIQSPWYKEKWGSIVQMAPDQNQKTEFQNTARGVMVATSVGGTATGKGGDVLVIDDGINARKAHSKPERETALAFVTQTFSTRLDDKKNGAIVVIEQRLHADDITGGWCMKEGGWTHIKLPVVAEKETVHHFPVTGRSHVRQPGDLLWPEREGPAELAQQKKTMGSRGFEAQYQQNPASDEAALIKRVWWKFYRQDNLPKDLDIVMQSWDMAFKDEKENSFVVGQVWAKRGADMYLLDQTRDHLNFPASVRAVKTMSAKWPQSSLKLIEDKANGTAIIATLQHKLPGIVAIQPEGSKEARVAAVSPFIEAGNVWLPHPDEAQWVLDFIEECAAFPGGSFNDQVDAMSQAILRLQFVEQADDSGHGDDVFGIGSEEEF